MFQKKPTKGRRLRYSSRKDIEPHEVLLDELSKKKEEEGVVYGKRIEVPLLRNILRFFLLFSISAITLLFLKTLQLQIFQGEEFLTQANENKFIISKIQASRGVVYDRNLKQLVFNLPSFRLICHKENLPQLESERKRVLHEISHALGKELLELEQVINQSPNETLLIADYLDHQTLIILETKIANLPGFEIEQSLARDYLEGEDFSHLMGYMGKISSPELQADPEFYSILDYVGRSGIEKSFEQFLRKNPGKMQIERDALGNIISKEIIELPKSGQSLVLWLDSDLQKKLKEELEKKLDEIGAQGAVAIALDPNTGGVLSLVSLPSFDNNVFSHRDSEGINKLLSDSKQPLFNRAISGRYPTGSTIKPLVAAAALEEQIISANKIINCQGRIIVEDFWDPEKFWEYEDWRTHGWTDIREAIAESCNVYFYQIGGGYKTQEGLGPTKIKEYLELFGWGQENGIDLPGKVSGFIPDKAWKQKTWGQGWWDGDTYLLSIGQGYLLIPPIEVVSSFLPIANGGKLLKPQLVKQIIDTSNGKNQAIKEVEPEIIRENFIDSENIKVIREGMRQAVSGWNSPYASAVLLSTLPVKAAAKTGTAETPAEDLYHNWITVFAPYDNPEIVLTIMIEDVEGVRAAALPVAKEVLEWYFTPEETLLLNPTEKPQS